MRRRHEGRTTGRLRLALKLLLPTVLALGFLLPAGATANAQGADDPARVDAGASIFENNCSGCHGADGTGSATGRSLIDIVDENDRAVHVTSVADGKGSMPAFGTRLSEDEVADVVSYVRLSLVSESDDDSEAGDSSQPAAPALAKTGVESYQVVIIGVTMILAGSMMLRTRKHELA